MVGFQVLALLTLLPPDYIMEYAKEERARIAYVLGSETEGRIHGGAKTLFELVFIKSHVQPAVNKFLEDGFNTEDERDPLKDNPILIWAEKRFEAFWLGAFMAFYRASTVFHWLIPAMALAIPAFLDGLLEREKRKWRFIFSSPGVHASGRAFFTVAMLAFIGIFLLPIRVDVTVYPLVILFAIVVKWAMLTNLSKRV
jgi:hypothetical protein